MQVEFYFRSRFRFFFFLKEKREIYEVTILVRSDVNDGLREIIPSIILMSVAFA